MVPPSISGSPNNNSCPREARKCLPATQVQTYELKSIALDGRSLRNVAADELPNRHDAGKQAGVLGNDLMDGAIAIFDFPCATVKLLPKPVNMREVLGGDLAPVQAGSVREGTQLTLPVTLNGVTVQNVQGRVMDLSSFETFGMADGPAMTLGADVMGGFKLVYDHQGKRIWFLSSACKR
jgi:hypothetical protein